MSKDIYAASAINKYCLLPKKPLSDIKFCPDFIPNQYKAFFEFEIRFFINLFKYFSE